MPLRYLPASKRQQLRQAEYGRPGRSVSRSHSPPRLLLIARHLVNTRHDSGAYFLFLSAVSGWRAGGTLLCFAVGQKRRDHSLRQEAVEQSGLNTYFGCQSPMNRTFVGNFQHLLTLLIGQITAQQNLRSIRSTSPSLVSQTRQSSAWIFSYINRTRMASSGHCFRLAYIWIVMAVHAPVL